jgi:hypothetical protein
LALFGRRPSVRGDSFVIPASENLHNSGNSQTFLWACPGSNVGLSINGVPYGRGIDLQE